jgi:hypothetical protein
MMILFLATGIFEIVKAVFRHSVNRLIFRQTYYDSDVFRYTQLSQRGTGGLFAGKYKYLFIRNSNVLL